MLYLRARWLNSTTATFLTKDTWRDYGRPQTLNGWSYALSNPVNYTDPSGHDPWWCDSQPDPVECRARAQGYDTTTTQQILRSTIFIHDVETDIIGECDTQTGEIIQRIITTRGSSLGTLVRYNGTFRLYTHNHYSNLANLDKVEFENSMGEFLGETTGADFRWRMALAQDAGNAVIVAPLSLLPGSLATRGLTLTPEYAEFGSPESVLPGHAVSIPHHTGDTITAVTARVMSKSASGNVPILNLQTASGAPVIGGDSGGGIWYRGRVVGNTWSTVNINIVDPQTGRIIDTRNTGQFIGAQLPTRFWQPKLAP